MPHSPLGPSSFARAYVCSGSVELQKVYSEKEDEKSEASIGTILHKALSSENEKEIKELLKDMSDWNLEAFQRAEEFKNQLIRNYDGFEVKKETELDLSFIAPEIGFGTADLVLIKPYEMGIVLDYKFFLQKGIAQAKDNDQTRLYSIGLAKKYELPYVKAYLYLPHLNLDSEADFDLETIEYLEREYRNKAQEIKNTPMKFQIGPHCKHCKCMAICPAQLVNALQSDPKQPMEMPGSAIADFLDRGENAKKWFEALSKFAYELLLKDRKAIPGYGLFKGKNVRSWKYEDIHLYLDRTARKLEKDPKTFWRDPEVKSPAQVEDAWGKSKKVREELEQLIETKAGALVMRKILEESEEENGKA